MSRMGASGSGSQVKSLTSLVPGISEDWSRAGGDTSMLVYLAFGKTVQFFATWAAHDMASPRVRERRRDTN